MKKIKIFAFLFLSLFIIGISSSFAITATYTGDNTIRGLWYYDGSAWNSLSLGSNATNWQLSDFQAIPDTWRQVVWQVENDDHNRFWPPSVNNPGGFLGQIGNLLSSSAWQVAFIDGSEQNQTPLPIGLDFDSLTWNFASTVWTSNQTSYGPYQNSTPSSVWYINNGPGPVGGIDDNAYWIWTAGNFGIGGDPDRYDSVFIRVTNPVPEPATMILVGSGLLGLVGLKRKFKK